MHLRLLDRYVLRELLYPLYSVLSLSLAFSFSLPALCCSRLPNT